ncbi:MAG: hypothetical protein AAF160_16260 [Pseudomonadota bacterium]
MPSLAFSTMLLLLVPPETPVDPQHDALFFRFDAADVSLTVVDAEAGAAEIAAAENAGASSQIKRTVTLGYDVTEITRSHAGSMADTRLFFELGGETLVITFAADAVDPDIGDAPSATDPAERVAAARARLRDLLKPGDAAGTRADGVTVYLDDFLLNDAAEMYAPHLPPGPTIRIEPEDNGGQ